MSKLKDDMAKHRAKYDELIIMAVEDYITDNREPLEETLQFLIMEHLEKHLPIEDADIPSWVEQPDALVHEMNVVLADLNIEFKLSIVKPNKIKKIA